MFSPGDDSDGQIESGDSDIDENIGPAGDAENIGPAQVMLSI